jgi:hypothetical protein
MSKRAPAAPDYVGAAQQQAASSREVTNQQTWANRPEQVTPWGSQTWQTEAVTDPASGQLVTKWTQNTNVDPRLQSALDSELAVQQTRNNLAQNLSGRLEQEFGQAVDFNRFTPMGQGVQAQQRVTTPSVQARVSTPQAQSRIDAGNPEQIQRNLSTDGLVDINPAQRYFDQAGDALYDQFASRADRQFSRDEDALRTRLLNQGFNVGDEAFDEELRKLRESQGDQRRQAMFDATRLSGQEASRMFGIDSTARGQMFGERSAQGQFVNDAADRAFGQRMNLNAFNLGQNQQMFGQDMARAAFDSAENLNQFSQGMQGAQFDAAQNDQQFQQQMGSSQYQNQLRQQQIAETLQQRGFTLNEINAIMSGQQVQMPTMPSFNPAAASQATNYLGAAQMTGQANLDRFNARNQATQGLLSGAMGMISPIKIPGMS